MSDTTRTPLSTPANDPVPFDNRTRRVMELRRQIQAGTYRPDSQEIAKAILGEWLGNGDLQPLDAAAPAVETAADRQQAASRFLVEKSGRPDAHSATRTA